MRLVGVSVIVCKTMGLQAGMLRTPAIQAGIAQLVEHDLAKVGVASSNLVSRSKYEKPEQCSGFFYGYYLAQVRGGHCLPKQYFEI